MKFVKEDIAHILWSIMHLLMFITLSFGYQMANPPKKREVGLHLFAMMRGVI